MGNDTLADGNSSMAITGESLTREKSHWQAAFLWEMTLLLMKGKQMEWMGLKINSTACVTDWMYT